DAAEVANRPAAPFVHKEQAVQGKWLTGRMALPGLPLIRAVQEHRARPAGDPDMVALAGQRVEFHIGQYLGRQRQLCIAPARPARIRTDEYQPPLPCCYGVPATQLYSLDAPSAQGIEVRGHQRPIAERGQSSPGTGQKGRAV